MKIDLHAILATIRQVGPIILATTPLGHKIPPDLIPTIVDAIGEAQAIKGATGDEKKAHVMNVIGTAVDVANTTGKVHLDADEIKSVASTGIDNVVATVKIIHGAKVAVDAPAAPPAAGE